MKLVAWSKKVKMIYFQNNDRNCQEFCDLIDPEYFQLIVTIQILPIKNLTPKYWIIKNKNNNDFDFESLETKLTQLILVNNQIKLLTIVDLLVIYSKSYFYTNVKP